jgi:hypothetical protein
MCCIEFLSKKAFVYSKRTNDYCLQGKCGRRQWYYACQVLNWELWTRFMAIKRVIFVSDVNCMLLW